VALSQFSSLDPSNIATKLQEAKLSVANLEGLEKMISKAESVKLHKFLVDIGCYKDDLQNEVEDKSMESDMIKFFAKKLTTYLSKIITPDLLASKIHNDPANYDPDLAMTLYIDLCENEKLFSEMSLMRKKEHSKYVQAVSVEPSLATKIISSEYRELMYKLMLIFGWSTTEADAYRRKYTEVIEKREKGESVNETMGITPALTVNIEKSEEAFLELSTFLSKIFHPIMDKTFSYGANIALVNGPDALAYSTSFYNQIAELTDDAKANLYRESKSFVDILTTDTRSGIETSVKNFIVAVYNKYFKYGQLFTLESDMTNCTEREHEEIINKLAQKHVDAIKLNIPSGIGTREIKNLKIAYSG
jgi:hypothetical protein